MEINKKKNGSTNSTKYLGIYKDAHLKWDFQINYIIKIIRSIVYKFKNLSYLLNIKYLLILHYAIVESHLTMDNLHEAPQE